MPTRMPRASGEAHQRPRRSRILLVGLPVFAVFAAFGVFAWLAYQEDARVPVGEPPLIKAAAGPFKLAPDDPGGREVADQGEINALLSDEPGPALPERVLPLPEEPRAPTLTALPSEESEPAASPGELPESVSEPEGAAKEAEAALARLLANVGSETPSPERQGAAVEQPAAAPASVATVPARRPTAPQSVVDAPAAVTGDPPPAAQADRPSSEADEALARLLAQVAGEPVPPDAQASAPASQPPRAVAAIAPAEPVSRQGAGFRIQLAAVRDEADARRAWTGLVERLGSLVADYEPYYQRAETSNGVFYRIQVGSFASERAADAVCVEVQRRNASCFVVAP